MNRFVPRWLTAELTHRCPLSCFYCSNPLKMSTRGELSTGEWLDTFEQGRALGCVQLGLTGGEPLMRPDLVEIVRGASGMGYYTNLITSAVGLTRTRLSKLRDAGLDSVQISFQAEQRDLNDFIGGKSSYEHKLDMMRAVRELEMPLTLNVVIHRLNIDRVVDICRLCESMEPDHVELASAQYHGWAHANRSVLMPTPDQIETAREAIHEFQDSRGPGVYYVLPDLIQKRAKRCQQGWGRTYVCVSPQGDVAPCLSAHTLPDVLPLPNVRLERLSDTWNGPLFDRFRRPVREWMTDVAARDHPRREEDLGGCRCQAHLLTGDVHAMDPADEDADGHADLVEKIREAYSTPTRLESLMPRKVTHSRVSA